MQATDYTERAFLNVLREINFNAPREVYVGLYVTNPTEQGAGIEMNYDGYERQKITFSPPAIENGVMTIKNTTQIDFPQAKANAGAAGYVGIHDSKIGGNMMAYGQLNEELNVGDGESPVLMTGEVEMYSVGNLSLAYKEKLLNVFRGEGIMGVKPYMALYNGNPDKGGAEIIAENYQRVLIEFRAPDETSAGQTVLSNNNDIQFNRPTTDWGNWNFNAIVDRDKNGEAIWIYDRGITKELKKGFMPSAKKDTVKVAFN